MVSYEVHSAESSPSKLETATAGATQQCLTKYNSVLCCIDLEHLPVWGNSVNAAGSKLPSRQRLREDLKYGWAEAIREAREQQEY
mmetsp:Transcript_4888/g.5639  ORF Transcript_4888/g.5639 Transcript_4888/m.5639 type:complete len:85 (-) Transcript_4888:3224-3478(-)